MIVHLTFDEMADVAFIEELNDDSKELILRVQSHILDCTECKAMYDKLYALRSTADRLVNDGPMMQKSAALRFIRTLTDNFTLTQDRVQRWFDKVISETSELYLTVVKTQLGRITEISSLSSDMFDFGYALPIGARGSETHGVIDKTVLIDDNDTDNRVSVVDGNCLVVQFRTENFASPDPHILIVSDTGDVRCSKLSQNGEVFEARFYGLEAGEYRVYFE